MDYTDVCGRPVSVVQFVWMYCEKALPGSSPNTRPGDPTTSDTIVRQANRALAPQPTIL
jgi:hypothetical protein